MASQTDTPVAPAPQAPNVWRSAYMDLEDHILWAQDLLTLVAGPLEDALVAAKPSPEGHTIPLSTGEVRAIQSGLARLTDQLGALHAKFHDGWAAAREANG